ncbi:MAG: hypothetical protein ACI87O_002792 [Planctomycetota bacterium]|jgi:hypothetical protein
MKQSHETNKAGNAVWLRESKEDLHALSQVDRGFWAGCGRHLVGIPLLQLGSRPFGIPDYSLGYHKDFGWPLIPLRLIVLMYAGVFQLIYMVPAYVWTLRRGTSKEYR